jgi:hypothetical protein
VGVAIRARHESNSHNSRRMNHRGTEATEEEPKTEKNQKNQQETERKTERTEERPNPKEPRNLWEDFLFFQLWFSSGFLSRFVSFLPVFLDFLGLSSSVASVPLWFILFRFYVLKLWALVMSPIAPPIHLRVRETPLRSRR